MHSRERRYVFLEWIPRSFVCCFELEDLGGFWSYLGICNIPNPLLNIFFLIWKSLLSFYVSFFPFKMKAEIEKL